MFTVYVLRSEKNNRLYTGYTEDLEKRIKEHNSGKTRSTKANTPYSLVYKEEYCSKTEARKREIFLKTGQGRKFIKSTIQQSPKPEIINI